VELRVIKVFQANEEIKVFKGIKGYRAHEDIKVFKGIKA
jgi:hypothetical protein